MFKICIGLVHFVTGIICMFLSTSEIVSSAYAIIAVLGATTFAAGADEIQKHRK